MILKQWIEEKCKNAFQSRFPSLASPDLSIEVTRSTKANFGHYQCNSAMKFSKMLQLQPVAIATRVSEALQQEADIQEVQVAGPGFINITLSKEALTRRCQEILDPHYFKTLQCGEREKVIVDFSSPNVAKEMHVGHLRSTIIGDALARLFAFLGYDVLRLNHIGDWGTAFGMLIAYLEKHKPDWLESNTLSLSELTAAYKAARKQFENDPVFKKEAHLAVVSLQSNEKRHVEAWEKICQISREAYQAIYDLLDVQLVERGESFYNPFLPDVIDDLTKKDLICFSEGAKCLFLEGFSNRQGEPLPFIVQKSDGGYNYATTEIAALRYRLLEEKADRIIYVTDVGQATHFAMLFATAKAAGYWDEKKVRLDHVPFGLVLDPDGKKFRTRSGETERLIDLLTHAIQKAERILSERNEKTVTPAYAREALPSLAQVLGINAVKYADLSCHRLHDYVFSYDRMLRFEGNTAAFLMYAYVRIQSIKRRMPHAEKGKICLEASSELSLGLHLCQFPEVLVSITEDLLIHRLCDYLYELAEKFHAFFRDCRVEGTKEALSRLALCELTAKILKQGLLLLGLKTVDRM